MTPPAHHRSPHAMVAIVGKWIAVIFGVLVALVVAGAVTGYLGLQTQVGGRLLRRIMVREVNKNIVGRLAVGEVLFRGTALELRNVVLFDPEDVPTVTVARLAVSYGLSGLFSRRVDVQDVEVDRPAVYLRQDSAGLNLSRAIAARHPKPTEPENPNKAKGKGWQVNLVRFGLHEGAVEFLKISAGQGDTPVRAKLVDLVIIAAGRVQTATMDGEGHLSVNGLVDGPGGVFREPLSINVHVVGTAGQPHGSGDVTLGKLVALMATLESDRDGELRIKNLRLPPPLAAALLPAWPVRVPLLLTGFVGLRGDIASTDLALRGEGVDGAVLIHGDGSVSARRTPGGILVDAKNVTLSDFSDRVPVAAPLNLAISVAPGSGLLSAQLTAMAKVDVPRTLLAGQAFGPLHLDLSVDRGVLNRLNLSLPLPGGVLAADGGQRDSKTALHVRFVATRIARMRAAAVAVGGGPIPALEGNGSLEITAQGPRLLALTGPMTGWTVVVKAIAPRLRIAGTLYRGIALDASLPDVARDHQAADISASLVVPLKVAATLSANATETTEQDAAAAGKAPRIDINLLRLAVSYPGTRWSTRMPARFSIEKSGSPSVPESRMNLENLALFAGAQEILASAQLDGKSLLADLQVKDLRIHDLPRIETVGVKVAGRLNANVHVTGDPQTPRVDVKVALRDGRADRYQGLVADVVATLWPTRAVNGNLRIGAPGLGNLAATFKGPAVAPLPASAPVDVTVDLTDVRLATLPLPPEAGVKANGVMQGHVELHGTVGNPRLALRFTGQRMTILQSPKVDAGQANIGDGRNTPGVRELRLETLSVDCSYVSPLLAASLNLTDTKHGNLAASGSARISLPELRTPGGPIMNKRPITGSLRLTNMDPDPISEFVPALKVIRGQISAAFEVRGTVAHPQLAGDMRWRKGEVVMMQEKTIPPQTTRLVQTADR